MTRKADFPAIGGFVMKKKMEKKVVELTEAEVRAVAGGKQTEGSIGVEG